MGPEILSIRKGTRGVNLDLVIAENGGSQILLERILVDQQNPPCIPLEVDHAIPSLPAFEIKG